MGSQGCCHEQARTVHADGYERVGLKTLCYQVAGYGIGSRVQLTVGIAALGINHSNMVRVQGCLRLEQVYPSLGRIIS